MKETRSENWERRLQRVERENRWLKRLGVVTGVGLSAILMMGQARSVPREVRAEKFSLQDAKGNVRAWWLTTPNGEAVVGFRGKEPEARMIMGVDPKGEPFLAFRDKDEKLRAMLSVQGGVPRLSLHSADGKERSWTSIETDGSPTQGIRDREGRPRSVLTVGPDNSPRLALAGKDGKPRVVLGGTAEQYGFAFFDAEGKLRGGLEMKADGSPSLLLTDKDEKVIWSAP